MILPTVQRLAWAVVAFIVSFLSMIFLHTLTASKVSEPLTDGDIMTRFIAMPVLIAIFVFSSLTACVTKAPVAPTTGAPSLAAPTGPFMAQVVGLQWLNPLQRRDYPTEWQLLWTLGLVKPNKNDDMVKAKPALFSTIQTVGMIAAGNDGRETFEGYHEKYFEKLMTLFHDKYFSYSTQFYNAHSLTDKKTWRELAGIHVEYALPEGKLDPAEAADMVRQSLISTFDIGNPHFPNAWTRSTPPDVRLTMGGPNAGFTSLAAALDYLQAHPSETVWAMNWDAPSRPKDKQINENLVLLVLVGPDYKTGRDPLAWIGYPAAKSIEDFEAQKGKPSRGVQAWSAVLATAAHHAGKADTDIGYVIHDGAINLFEAPARLGELAQALTTELIEFDYIKQTFNTPALLGDTGAGTALTNVALGIAYANHFGKNVLVAGTTDPAKLTGVLVVPPAKVRPINPDEPWFRARGENNAYLMWWGLRHDMTDHSQGYSN